jgi:hypothetical protein
MDMLSCARLRAT